MSSFERPENNTLLFGKREKGRVEFLPARACYALLVSWRHLSENSSQKTLSFHYYDIVVIAFHHFVFTATV